MVPAMPPVVSPPAVSVVSARSPPSARFPSRGAIFTACSRRASACFSSRAAFGRRSSERASPTASFGPPNPSLCAWPYATARRSSRSRRSARRTRRDRRGFRRRCDAPLRTRRRRVGAIARGSARESRGHARDGRRRGGGDVRATHRGAEAAKTVLFQVWRANLHRGSSDERRREGSRGVREGAGRRRRRRRLAVAKRGEDPFEDTLTRALWEAASGKRAPTFRP